MYFISKILLRPLKKKERMVDNIKFDGYLSQEDMKKSKTMSFILKWAIGDTVKNFKISQKLMIVSMGYAFPVSQFFDKRIKQGSVFVTDEEHAPDAKRVLDNQMKRLNRNQSPEGDKRHHPYTRHSKSLYISDLEVISYIPEGTSIFSGGIAVFLKKTPNFEIFNVWSRLLSLNSRIVLVFATYSIEDSSRNNIDMESETDVKQHAEKNGFTVIGEGFERLDHMYTNNIKFRMYIKKRLGSSLSPDLFEFLSLYTYATFELNHIPSPSRTPTKENT
jgi:hypothetical protein